MIVHTAILYTPEGDELFIAADGNLTESESQAVRFIDPVSAETAATRAMGYGWAFMIEEEEI